MSTHTHYLNNKYFASLDGIRALSILAVVWHHTHFSEAQPFIFLNRGFLGVDMFFILSGFLITTLLLREKQRNQRVDLKKFYMRRSLRIFPLYFLILISATVLFSIKSSSPQAQDFLSKLIYYYTYTSNWIQSENFMQPTWSLATEEQFYLVWPLIEAIAGKMLTFLILGCALIINQFLAFGLFDSFFSGWIEAQRPSLEILQITFTPILLGVAVAHILHSPKSFHWLRWLGRPYVSVIFLIGTFLLCNIAGNSSNNLEALDRLLIQISMSFLLASCVIQENHWLKPVLTNPILVRIGVISYGLYLIHTLPQLAIIIVIQRLNLQIPGFWFITTLVVTVLLAEVSYRYYETPFLKLKAIFKAS